MGWCPSFRRRECDIELDFMVGDHLLRCRMLGNYWTVTLLKNLSSSAHSPFLINNRLLLTEHKKYVGRTRFSAESNNKSKVTLTDARLLFVECEIEAIIWDLKCSAQKKRLKSESGSHDEGCLSRKSIQEMNHRDQNPRLLSTVCWRIDRGS